LKEQRGSVSTSFKETVLQKEVVMTADTQQYQILEGPSREELFFALWLRHEGRRVSFTVIRSLPPGLEVDETATSELVKVLVNGVHIEDGRGNSWIIRVYPSTDLLGGRLLKGCYNTRSRKGWLRPVEDR
jgi:hypothetical protein